MKFNRLVRQTIQ